MQFIKGDITKIKDIDVLVNSANGCGIMGAGVAGVLAKAGGDKLKNAAFNLIGEIGIQNPGSCYETIAGRLEKNNVKSIYHAVVMEKPGGFTSIEIIADAMEKTINRAINKKMKSIAFPGMGTGIGKLDKFHVAEIMLRIARKYESKIEITFIDLDEHFIKHLEKNYKEKSNGSNREPKTASISVEQ